MCWLRRVVYPGVVHCGGAGCDVENDNFVDHLVRGLKVVSTLKYFCDIKDYSVKSVLNVRLRAAYILVR